MSKKSLKALGWIWVEHTRLHACKRTWHWPALIDVVNNQRAQKEDEENGYEHVVDGSDVADLKQFADEEEDRQKKCCY